MERRELIQLLSFAAIASGTASAQGRSRPAYGGSVQFSLPVGLKELDPHNPEDLGASLLGPALFETLYRTTSTGVVYPTLAADLPIADGNDFKIPLRANLTFSSGRVVSPDDVIASLKRSQKSSSALSDLQFLSPRISEPLVIRARAPSEEILARRLACPRAAILSKSGPARIVDSLGAMQVRTRGSKMSLIRNAWAPRGGSFLESAIVRTQSVTDCLRAFESTRSDLGFLGSGLHQSRKGVEPFQLQSLGLSIMLAGQKAPEFRAPGVLHESLRHLPRAPFEALGVKRPRSDTRSFRGRDLEVCVSQDEPWFLALANEIARAWSAVRVHVNQVSRAELNRLKKSRDFDLMLTGLSVAGFKDRAHRQETLIRDLFALDQKKPPRGGRRLPPTEAGRQLSLGILGELKPRGAVSSELIDLVSDETLHLEVTQRRRGR